MFGICNLAVIPLRVEPSDRSEIVSQLLFGEQFEIIEQQKQWRKVKLHFDQYEGWIDEKQLQQLSTEEYLALAELPLALNGDCCPLRWELHWLFWR